LVHDNTIRGNIPELEQYPRLVIPALELEIPSPSLILILGLCHVTAQLCKGRALLQRPENPGPTQQSTVISVTITLPAPPDQCLVHLRPPDSLGLGPTELNSENLFPAVKAVRQLPDSQALPDLPDRSLTAPDLSDRLVVLVPDLTHTVIPEHHPHQLSPENTGGVLTGAGSYDALYLSKSSWVHFDFLQPS